VFHWKRRPELNGIWWPVIEGCDQYTFTVSTRIGLSYYLNNIGV